MVAPHPIKEFNEEVEPENRHCLFCKATPPADLRANDMTWKNRGKVGWYSNALLHLDTREIARFYICGRHFHLVSNAWEWAKGYTQRRMIGVAADYVNTKLTKS